MQFYLTIKRNYPSELVDLETSHDSFKNFKILFIKVIIRRIEMNEFIFFNENILTS